MDLRISKLTVNRIYYNSPEKCEYNPEKKFDNEEIIQAFNFAYDMSFGTKGEHRDHRSGGTHHRRNGEIFANAFQGKLAEIGFKRFFEDKYENKYKLTATDFSCSKLGTWDSCDFQLGSQLISIKSTKHYSRLLLLEEKDWDEEGCYIHNKCKYFMIALVRIGIDIDKILKENKLLYSDECKKNELELILQNIEITCDFPGYIKHEDLLYIIKNNIKIEKGDFLNKTEMDASNYYIQAKDLRKWP